MMNNTNKNPPSFEIGFCLAPPVGLEPNDDRSLRKLRELADGACAIAHNPRKRGDGVLAENQTKRARKKGIAIAIPFFWPHSTKMQLNKSR